MSTIAPARRKAWEEAAEAIYERYAVEVIEALHLCPWAERSRKEGHVGRRVVLADGEAALAPALEGLAAFGEDTNIEVGLLILPWGSWGRRDFERFVAKLRDADRERCGTSPPMALAAFHPDAEADLGSGARLVPFVRRSPDPTIQCVRLSVLESVRRPVDSGTNYVDLSTVDLASLLEAKAPKKPLHQRVAEANRDTIEKHGVKKVEAILEDIAADREKRYARLRDEDAE